MAHGPDRGAGEALPASTRASRVRLGLPIAAVSVTTRVPVADMAVTDRLLMPGLIVDRMLDVADFSAGSIKTTPDIGGRWRSDYVEGVVRGLTGFIVLLDASNIFSAEDETFAFSDLRRAARA